MLQLLKEIDPRIVRIAIIYNPQTAPFGVSFVRYAQSAGPALGVEPIGMPLQDEADIEASIATFARLPGGGLIAIPDAFFLGQHRLRLVAAVAQNHLPALYANLPRPFEGLMTYAVDTRDLMRRAAEYVDRILNGTDPADLPVQTPTRFNLVINRKVADSLGGRKTYAERNPALVEAAKAIKNRGGRVSLRKVAAALAEQGFTTSLGKPYSASAVQSMLNA
jgi:putative tryptophan/tyrosine transport system substrate-binding protein